MLSSKLLKGLDYSVVGIFGVSVLQGGMVSADNGVYSVTAGGEDQQVSNEKQEKGKLVIVWEEPREMENEEIVDQKISLRDAMLAIMGTGVILTLSILATWGVVILIDRIVYNEQKRHKKEKEQPNEFRKNKQLKTLGERSFNVN